MFNIQIYNIFTLIIKIQKFKIPINIKKIQNSRNSNSHLIKSFTKMKSLRLHGLVFFYFFVFLVPPVRLLPLTYPHPRSPFPPFFPSLPPPPP